MRASDRAYSALRAEILDWSLEPGTALGEVEQAARLGISRTPIREALSRLAADGLVEAQSGRGFVVTAASVDSVVQLFELREALECRAAALAAERREVAVFTALQREFEDVSQLLANSSRDGYYDLVRRFDESVDDAVGNPYLIASLRALRTHLVRIRRLSRFNTDRLRTAAAEHLVIVDAIVAGDAWLAASATRVHLHQSLRNILDAADPGRAQTTVRTA